MRRYLAFVQIVCVCTLTRHVRGQSTFNYETNLRVQDNLQALAQKVGELSNIPLQIMKGIVNISTFNRQNAFTLGRTLYSSLSVVTATEIVAWNMGFSSKEYLAYKSYYGINTITSSSGQFFIQYGSGNGIASAYTSTLDGWPKNFFANSSYDPTTRPWYVVAKSLNSPGWTAAYITVGPTGDGQPAITWSSPIPVGGKRFGAMGAILQLRVISTYLQTIYRGTSTSVFIVEKGTNVLIASSIPVTLFTSLNGKNSLVLATNADAPLIAGATQTLIDQNWPSNLIIYKGNYLQNLPFSDKIPGISWYVVVLFPAPVEDDHIGPDTSYYTLALAISVLSISFSVVSLSVLVYFWRTRMMQFTQPLFTIVSLIGCMLLCVACIFFLGDNNENNCIARPYLFNMAFTIGFSPLLVKSGKVCLTFVYSWTASVLVHGGKKKLITMPELLAYIFAFLAIDAALLTGTGFSSGNSMSPYTTVSLSTNGAYGQFTFCGYHKNPLVYNTLLGYKAAMILIACFLAFKIRNVADSIGGSKALLIVVYNCALIGGIIVALVKSLSMTVPAVVMCQTVGICCCVVITNLVMVYPTVYTLIYVGDNVAANEVIDEMYKGKQELDKQPQKSTTFDKKKSFDTRSSIEQSGSPVSTSKTNWSILKPIRSQVYSSSDKGTVAPAPSPALIGIPEVAGGTKSDVPLSTIQHQDLQEVDF